tara:strand:+ start:13088 stop:14458 length:1371 start_codon:yes stop_codon:yes gene_type:complete
MKIKLARFEEFADRLYPSEVEYVLNNNQFTDAELFNILSTIQKRVNQPEANIGFDTRINPRKYSKLIKSFESKLNKIDVDKYYTWINTFNFQVTTDAIPPEEQTRVLAEIRSFDPSRYHADVFYQAMENYKTYLIMRGRTKDLSIVKDFLVKHRVSYDLNRSMLTHIETLTEQIVLEQQQQRKQEIDLTKIEDMLTLFRNENLSKKTRYMALLAYIMYHINHADVEKLVAPITELENAIHNGEFYSPRLLANFYANKLLILNSLGDQQGAAFCGLQSIKHYTEDYLYYLNNYTTVLIHLDQCRKALDQMKETFEVFKKSRNLNHRMVFISNYCRCLNESKKFTNTVRLMRNYLEEFKEHTLEHRWNYFFRTYLYGLIMSNQNSIVLRLNRKYKLVEREENMNIPPYINLLTSAAAFNELKITRSELEQRLEGFKKHPRANMRADYRKWVSELEDML